MLLSLTSPNPSSVFPFLSPFQGCPPALLSLDPRNLPPFRTPAVPLSPPSLQVSAYPPIPALFFWPPYRPPPSLNRSFRFPNHEESSFPGPRDPLSSPIVIPPQRGWTVAEPPPFLRRKKSILFFPIHKLPLGVQGFFPLPILFFHPAASLPHFSLRTLFHFPPPKVLQYIFFFFFIVQKSPPPISPRQGHPPRLFYFWFLWFQPPTTYSYPPRVSNLR